MEKEYCCETMRSAIEEWGGVEICNGTYYEMVWDESHWVIINECPWCGDKLTVIPKSEE
jgi:hypothetical protein